MEGKGKKLCRKFFLLELYYMGMINTNDRIEFLSSEIQRLEDLIERLTPYADEVGPDKQSNRLILDDAILKKQVCQDLLSDL